jgi:tungstate transport system substrate-binding protein
MLKKLSLYYLNIYLIKFFLFSILINIYSFDTSFGKEYIILQSTTSTQNSGLYDYILPIFSNLKDVDVRVVAVGTGQAIKNAQNCDGDVLIVHSKDSEENFVKSGFGLYRKDLMYNDFVIIGPENDPAKVKSSDNAFEAFKKIFDKRAIFSSRGDESGTHKAEIRMWNNLNINTNDFSGGWYRELGLGMGATLNVAVQMDAYVLSDRATWLAFKNKRQHLILFEGDENLFNQYGIIPVNPNKCPSVKTNLSKIFIDWMLSIEGQNYISSYKKNGQQLFFPN